jgi:hypothetical protein
MVDVRKRLQQRPWEKREVVGRIDDYTIERVQTPKDYGTETVFLWHCLGTKNFERFEIGHRVFSLRDKHGIPHATILTLKPNVVSAYGSCADLGVIDNMNVGGEALRVLQVRGRNDELAAPRFLRIAGKWWEECSGRQIPDGVKHTTALQAHIFGDSDMNYHLNYQMEPSKNPYKNAKPDEADSIRRDWVSW